MADPALETIVDVDGSEPFGPEDFCHAFGLPVSPQALADLRAFQDILTRANAVMNLVGPASLPHYWSRHVLDSAQLLRKVPQAKTWADLGAGAGFPGVVLAILLKQTPDAKVFLVESLTKRCRFLQEAVEVLQLPAEVCNARAEDLDLCVEVVTARAVAPLEKLFGFAHPYIRRGALGVFLKGENVSAELQQAQKTWKFSADASSSLSDPRGRVLTVRSLYRG